MNHLVFDGVVGAVSPGKNRVSVSVAHRSHWRDAKDNTWKTDESWFTVSFFGAKMKRALEIRPGQAIVIEGEITTYPKSGPDQRIRITCQSFHLVNRTAEIPNGETEDEEKEV